VKITKEISLGDVAARSEELRGENMTLNMGPSTRPRTACSA